MGQDKIETLDDDNQAIETILNRVNASSFKGGNEYDAKGSGNGAPSSSKFAKSLKKMQDSKSSFNKRDGKGDEKGSFKSDGNGFQKGSFKGGAKGDQKGSFKGGAGAGNKRKRTI